MNESKLPPHCAVSLPILGDVPANAPAIPISDGSSGYTGSLALSTAQSAVTTTPDDHFFLARFASPPAVGQLTLSWSLGCSSGAAPKTGTWEISTVDAAPLPSGEIGESTTNGSIASIAASHSSRAFGRLSTFAVRLPDGTISSEMAFHNEVRDHNGALAGGPVERIDVGYTDAFRPGAATAGVLDLTLPLGSAAKAVCHDATSGTQTGDITVEQHVVGSDVAPAQTTATVTVDCAKADEAWRASQGVPVDGGGCHVGQGHGDGGWIALVVLGLVMLGRGVYEAARDWSLGHLPRP